MYRSGAVFENLVSPQKDFFFGPDVGKEFCTKGIQRYNIESYQNSKL